MYQLYAEGVTVSDIRRTILEKGYKSFRGSMSNRLITKALDSDLYIGKRTVKAQFSESGEDEIIENDHDAVIGLELNEKVKARRIVELKKQERRLATNKAKKEAQNGTNGRNMKLGVFFLHRVTGGGGAGTILRKWTLPYKQRLSSVHSSPASCSPEHYLV